VTTPFENVLFEHFAEQGTQAFAEGIGSSRADVIAQDFALLLFGAPTVSLGSLLELRSDIVVNVATRQLTHNVPPRLAHNIACRRPMPEVTLIPSAGSFSGVHSA
jgi:hypothetical protein